MKRSTLVGMQIIGALTLLGYPMVVIASLMSLGAPTEGIPAWQAALSRVVLIAVMLYPLIWAVLWISSWSAFKRGRPRQAALLSAPPLLALVAAAGVVVFSGAYGAWSELGYRRNEAKEMDRIGRENGLLAAAMRFEAGQLSWPELEDAIRQADKRQLTTAVQLLPVEIPGVTVTRMPDAPPDPIVMRTPLGYLLERSYMGSSYDVTRARPHFVDATRLLLARGATLAPEEIEHNPELPLMLEAVAQESPQR